MGYSEICFRIARGRERVRRILLFFFKISLLSLIKLFALVSVLSIILISCNGFTFTLQSFEAIGLCFIVCLHLAASNLWRCHFKSVTFLFHNDKKKTFSKSNSHSILTISACTVASYKSPAEIEENTVTSTCNFSMPEPRNATTIPQQCEPTISREEYKEGCTFGSKVLPASERILHTSQCSMITAVTCTDADDAKSVRKTSIVSCSYCGEHFEVPQLVEHVPRCKDVSRLKAEEVSPKDGSPSSPVIGGADCVEDPSVGDKRFFSKCRQEFSLLELLNHTDECREDALSTRSDEKSSLEDARDPVDSSDDEQSIEKIVYNDGKDDVGDEVLGRYDSLDRDEGKGDGHSSLSDNVSCGDEDDRIAEEDHDVDGGSAFDDVKSDEDREDNEEGEADDVEVNDLHEDESNARKGIIRRFSFDDCYHDDE